MTSSKNPKKLTQQLILAKTKLPNIGSIKNLNLWGNELQDLSIIAKMPNLEVISLSVNKIATLKYFRKCQKLQELYLRKNSVEDIKEIKYLVELPLLKILWLHDNPCAEIKNYRLIVIKNLIHLVKLDNSPVSLEQRETSQEIIFDLGKVEEEQEEEEKVQTDQQEEIKANIKEIQSVDKKFIVEGGEQKSQISMKKWNKKSVSMDFAAEENLREQKQQPSPQPPSPFKRSHPRFSRQEKMRKSKDISSLEQNFQKNQNVLMAVLSLMRQLDPASIQIVKREADKMSRPL